MNDGLPPLPDPLVMVNRYGGVSSTSDGDGGVFTADQLRTYARAAVAADRARRAEPAAPQPAVPAGWYIEQEGDTTKVVSPLKGPGMLVVCQQDRTLANRLLFALCAALDAAPQGDTP